MAEKVKSDIEIAQQAHLVRITELARQRLGIDADLDQTTADANIGHWKRKEGHEPA